jgi:hypothetical protein
MELHVELLTMKIKSRGAEEVTTSIASFIFQSL